MFKDCFSGRSMLLARGKKRTKLAKRRRMIGRWPTSDRNGCAASNWNASPALSGSLARWRSRRRGQLTTQTPPRSSSTPLGGAHGNGGLRPASGRCEAMQERAASNSGLTRARPNEAAYRAIAVAKKPMATATPLSGSCGGPAAQAAPSEAKTDRMKQGSCVTKLTWGAEGPRDVYPSPLPYSVGRAVT